MKPSKSLIATIRKHFPGLITWARERGLRLWEEEQERKAGIEPLEGAPFTT